MTDHNDHTHHGLSLTTKLALGGAIIAGGIILAPYVLPAIGLGTASIAEESLYVLHNETLGHGLAGALGGAISHIPLIGAELAKGGWFNIAATAITGLGGVLLGNWMSKNHEGKPGINWGKVVKWAGLATSALISLPSILTGITNGLIYLARETLSLPAASVATQWVVDTIGSLPYPDMFNSGLNMAASTLPHLLTCGASFFPVIGGVIADRYTAPDEQTYVALDTKGNPLPAHDANHAITKAEQQLVAEYNAASPVQKILLKKSILAQGYDPDFHADGTVHLFKHHAQPLAMAR